MLDGHLVIQKQMRKNLQVNVFAKNTEAISMSVQNYIISEYTFAVQVD